MRRVGIAALTALLLFCIGVIVLVVWCVYALIRISTPSELDKLTVEMVLDYFEDTPEETVLSYVVGVDYGASGAEQTIAAAEFCAMLENCGAEDADEEPDTYKKTEIEVWWYDGSEEYENRRAVYIYPTENFLQCVGMGFMSPAYVCSYTVDGTAFDAML